MVMPPRIAPSHVVILPILRKGADPNQIIDYCNGVAEKVRAQTYHGRPVEVVVDTRDMNAGEKGWDWIKKGIPVRAEIGPRDMEKNAVFVGRRDKGPKEKTGQNKDEFAAGIVTLLDEIQANLFERARAFQVEHTREIDAWEDFTAFFTPKNTKKPEIHGGFATAHWCDDEACENRINDELSVTIRCIPFDRTGGPTGSCIACGKESPGRVVFAKSY
jgi:prolyl-tRNA synthetase